MSKRKMLRFRIIEWISGKLQGVCEHPPELTSYDISEGGAVSAVAVPQDPPRTPIREDFPISWCQVCGAVRLSNSHEWRRVLGLGF